MSSTRENYSPLTAEDISFLDSIVVADRTSGSVARDINRWTQTVSDLRGQYTWCSDEYFNDVASRTSLQLRLQQTDGALAVRFRQFLNPIDALFLERTEPMVDPFWNDMPPHCFWCYRIPKVVAKEYEEDFNYFRVRDAK